MTLTIGSQEQLQVFSTSTNTATINLLLQDFDPAPIANKVFQTIVRTLVTLNENTIDYD